MKIYEYAYLCDSIIVREVDCTLQEDIYIGVGVAQHKDKLGELIGNFNIFLMYLTERNDMKFIEAVAGKICAELKQSINRVDNFIACAERYLQKERVKEDE